MNILISTKDVFRELSPVLAGLKLGLIVVSWIGVGSAAKWVVEHWYPFTRNFWDIVTTKIGFTIMDVAIKDSLTALVFFLPLGITAFYTASTGSSVDIKRGVQVLSGVLGLIFFFLVTKEALQNIVGILDRSEVTARTDLTSQLVIGVIALSIGMTLMVVVRLSRKHPIVLLLVTIFVTVIMSIVGFLWLYLSFEIIENHQDMEWTVFPTLILLSITLWCLLLAYRYTPKKLLITGGAAVSFVAAAFLFEFGLVAMSFIESSS